MTSLPEQVKFMRKLKSTNIYTQDAATFEELCKKEKDCFEIVPCDDIIIKPYFDIDYTLKEGEEYSKENGYMLLFYSLALLHNYFTSHPKCGAFEVDFAIKNASGKKLKKGELVDFYSFHVIIYNGVKTTKKVLNEMKTEINAYDIDGIKKEINKYVKIGDDDLFDESVYNPARVMRTAYSCKDDDRKRPFNLISRSDFMSFIENRILTDDNIPDSAKWYAKYLFDEIPEAFISDKFNDTIISAFINEESLLWQVVIPEKSKPVPVVPNKAINIMPNTNNDEILVNMVLEKMPTEMAGFSNKYDSWIKIGFIFKNTFEDTLGWDLFDKFSKLGGNSYDFIKNRELWDSWKTKEEAKNPIGMGTLIEMLKKANKQMLNEIQKEIKTIKKEKIFKNGDNRFGEEDNRVAEMIMEDVKEILLPSSQGRMFYKKNNIWICDKNVIDDQILNFILTSKIYKYNDDFKLIPYVQNVKSAKSVREALYVKIRTQENVVDIYEKFHTTTKRRLCFKDGVLDFKTRAFYKWDAVDFEYYSTEMINYEYAEYFNNPNMETVATIKANIYENLFGNKTTKALNFLSRAIAGHSEDKNWATYLGNRDSGKGVKYDNVKHAFGPYVKTFELGNIMYERSTDTQEVSRKLYWLLDFEFARLGISQETPPPSSNLKVNGKMLKKLAGGGDEHVARRNFDRIDTHFKIDTTFMFFGNNQLEVDIKDTMEHCIQFSSVNQFKSQEEIDRMKEEGASDLLCASYKIKDPNIKDMCATDEWKKATVYLMYQNYVESALINDVDTSDNDDREKTLRQTILEKYEITGVVTDYLLLSDVVENLNDCKKKISNELASMGVMKKKSNMKNLTKDKICFFGLKGIKIPVIIPEI